jgi:hypothetical protein
MQQTRPRGVSIATGIGSSGLSPAADSIAVISVTPSRFSSMRRFASSAAHHRSGRGRDAPSAQSIPQ